VIAPPVLGALPEGAYSAIAAASALFLAILFARIAKALRDKGQRGAGIFTFLAFVYVPAAVLYATLSDFGANTSEVVRRVPLLGPDGAPVLLDKVAQFTEALVREPTSFSRVLFSFLVLFGVYALTTFLDLVLFVRAFERGLGLRVPRILRDTVRWLLLLWTFFVVLADTWGFHFESLVWLSGSVAVVLGFALSPTLGALFSGIALTSERPFELGDWIEVGNKQGRVDQITWRSTRITTRDRENVILPNGVLANERIINLSRPDQLLGIRFRVGVHYRTPPHLIREILRREVVSAPGVMTPPEPIFRVIEFADSAVMHEVKFFIKDIARLEDIKAEVMQRVWYAFQRERIEIPFPIRNVILRQEQWGGEGTSPEVEREKLARRQEVLRRLPLFRGIPPKTLERLASHTVEEYYLPGELVVVEGEIGDRMFVVTRGSARVTVDKQGTQEVAILKEGDFFGEMSLLTGAPRAATVVAPDGLQVISLRASDLGPLLRENPDVARLLADVVAARTLGLKEVADRASLRKESGEFDSTSTSLLSQIVGFFRLPHPDE